MRFVGRRRVGAVAGCEGQRAQGSRDVGTHRIPRMASSELSIVCFLSLSCRFYLCSLYGVVDCMFFFGAAYTYNDPIAEVMGNMLCEEIIRLLAAHPRANIALLPRRTSV